MRFSLKRLVAPALGLLILLGIIAYLYSLRATVERQDAEITLLVRNAAIASNERDRLDKEVAAERARVAATKATIAEQQARIAAADSQLADLRGQLESANAGLERAKSDVGALRERAQTAQGDARDSSAAAAAAAAALRVSPPLR